MAVAGLYRRILPCPPAVEFSSREGKDLFREALLNGTMEGFFKIISYFQTQSEPAFCGLASLSIVLNALAIDPGRKWKALLNGTMEGFFKIISYFQTQSEPAFCGLASLSIVLNALAIDPGRKWKGPWRWFDETMLDCCDPLEKVKVDGITFGKLVCLANCAGAKIEAFRTNQSSLQRFRGSVARCASSEDCHIIVSYHRALLRQTGSGHFSPIGGYHAEKDMVLILDVARFKYPPHWVPLSLLWEAMNTKDEETQHYRGFMMICKREVGPSLLYTLSCRQESWKKIAHYLVDQVPLLLKSDHINTIEDVLSIVFGSLPADPSEFIKWIAEMKSLETCENTVPKEESERQMMKREILQKLRETRMHLFVSNWLSATSFCCGSTWCVERNDSEVGEVKCPESRDLLTVLILGLPLPTWREIKSEELKKEIYNLVSLHNLQCGLQEEVLHLRRQLLYLYLCHTGRLEEDFREPSIQSIETETYCCF